jgi:methyl-CpG-binding domain protein 4
VALKLGWIPPKSPYKLLQELLWPDEWLVLVACMMLNCTTRKQVDKIFDKFREQYPKPEKLLVADPVDVAELIKSLGFKNRRTKNIFNMSSKFISNDWKDASELPGIGEYGTAAHKIFFCGKVPLVPPRDHALKEYADWYNETHQRAGVG